MSLEMSALLGEWGRAASGRNGNQQGGHNGTRGFMILVEFR